MLSTSFVGLTRFWRSAQLSSSKGGVFCCPRAALVEIDDRSMCRLSAVVMLVFWSVSSYPAVGEVDINGTACAQLSVLVRPDNYLRCLRYYGQCLEHGARRPYDRRYYDAVRRNVASSSREFAARRDVLPSVRRMVYDTANLYQQRIGRTVYRHETCAAAAVPVRQTSESNAAAGLSVRLSLAVAFVRFSVFFFFSIGFR